MRALLDAVPGMTHARLVALCHASYTTVHDAATRSISNLTVESSVRITSFSIGRIVFTMRKKMRIFIVMMSMLILGFASSSISACFTFSHVIGTSGDNLLEPSARIHPQDAINALILIDGNAALDAYCAGNGTDGLTPATAHVIRDLVLNASTIANGSGIVIQNTTRYLVIRNCTVIEAHTSGQFAIPGIGICLWNTNHISVTNCTLSMNDCGVSIKNLGENIISNNTCSSNWAGVTVENSENNSIIRNTLTYNEVNGIWFSANSRNNIVTNNVVVNTGFSPVDNGAIALFEADSNSIIDNNVSNNLGNGIFLFESRGNTIADNKVIGNAGACIKLVWFPWSWDHFFLVLNDIHGNVNCNDPQWTEPIASWSTISIIAAVVIVCCTVFWRHSKRNSTSRQATTVKEKP